MKKIETFKPYSKHIFVCVGDKCSNPNFSKPLYEKLKDALKTRKLDQGDQRIHRSKTTCLGVCEQGPVAVVYPEGVWYCSLNEDKLDRIIEQHLVGGSPVEDYIFHKHQQRANL